MRSLDSPSTTTLRQLFDKFVELPARERAEAFANLDLPTGVVERLRKMILFAELCTLDEKGETAVDARSTGASRALLDAMLERDRHLRRGGAALLRQFQQDDSSGIAESLVGTTIGTFRLVALIGQGGSSSVFHAERQAGDGVQRVALKLLRVGLYSSEAQRRFRREQAILARLDHPNIARLIEGGVSQAGVPYIAMELVDGSPLTAAANERRLGIRERLAWFVILCRAIESAHASLIIHRDLKPSNLMVNRDGVLKVLDFGIAKLVESEATRTQWVALTPDYAAPEQFEQGPMTTAVDVYALGVVLRELLTGQPKKGRSSASQAAAANITQVRNGLPPPAALAQRLRGDLDAIVVTAMAEEPRRRYLSAGALAEDVERHLSGQPVRAVTPSRWYVATKFVTRHRLAILAASVLFGAELASLSLALWQGLQVRRAARVAQAQAARADSMRNFIFDTFAQAEPAKPHDGPVTLNEVVDAAIQRTRSDRSIDPRARIELLARLGEVVATQGDLDKAGVLLETVLGEATETLGPNDRQTLELAQAVETNHELQGDYPRARAEADALLARLPDDALELRLNVLRDSADIAVRTRDQTRADSDIEHAVDLARRSGNLEMLRKVLEECGIVMMAGGRPQAAINVLEEVLSLTRRRFGEESSETAAILGDLSRNQRRAGNLKKAEQYARAALVIDRKIYPGDHWVTANHLNALGQALVARRALDEALATYTEGERISEATLGAAHPETASALQALAYVQMQLEHYDVALGELRVSLKAKLDHFGPHHWETAFVRSDYGFALAANGNVRAGEKEMDQAIADLAALESPDPHALGRALEKRTRFALMSGGVDVAASWIDRLAKAAAEATPQADYWAGRVDCIRGEIALRQGRFEEAVTLLRRSAVAQAEVKMPDPVLAVDQRLLLALASARAGDAVHAGALAEDARARLAALPHPPTRFRARERELGVALAANAGTSLLR